MSKYGKNHYKVNNNNNNNKQTKKPIKKQQSGKSRYLGFYYKLQEPPEL